MKDTLSYSTFARETLQLKDNEVALFTNHGVFRVSFSEFDAFHEEMEVSRGEEGLTNVYLFAVTNHAAYSQKIWEAFTLEEGF